MSFTLHENRKCLGYEELYRDRHVRKLTPIKPLPNTPPRM
jgi:hypothetical protein